jgi:hypothetical protein
LSYRILLVFKYKVLGRAKRPSAARTLCSGSLTNKTSGKTPSFHFNGKFFIEQFFYVFVNGFDSSSQIL